MPRAATKSKSPASRSTAVGPDLDWRRIAYHVVASRALDDLEEATNRNRGSVPREHVVLYQFSARGHDVAQTRRQQMTQFPATAHHVA